MVRRHINGTTYLYTTRINVNGGRIMFDDKKIVRMTIVYEDGSMTILKKEKNGMMSIDRRRKTK